MALDGRSVVELDHVRTVAPRPGPCLYGADAGPHGHAVLLECPADDVGVAWMVGRGEARSGLDDGRRYREALIDLGELAAGRAAAEDDKAAWQLPGQRRLLVGPRLRRLETG